MASGHEYLWIGQQTGGWSTALNWQDLTLGRTAIRAPGAADTATLNGPADPFQTQAIVGLGAAAALTLTGNTSLGGPLTLGRLSSNSGAGSTFSVGTLTITGAVSADQATIGGALAVTGSGALRARALDVTAPAYYAWSLDPQALIEVGSGTAGAAGMLTIDADGTLAVQGGSLTLAQPVVDDGVLSLAAGAYASLSNLGGRGQVRLGSGAALSAGALSGTLAITLGDQARLSVGQSAATGVSVAMTGAGSLLELDEQLTFPWTYAIPTPTVTGFGADDAILVRTVLSDGTVTGLAYDAAAGTLDLLHDAARLATLAVQTGVSGAHFTAFAVGAGRTAVVLTPDAGAAQTASAGTSGHDFVWTGAPGGLWNAAANWRDASAAAPALIAPGARDSATIVSAPGLPQMLGGVGNIASLTLGGEIGVTGRFTAATLTANPGSTGGVAPLASGTLCVSNGGRLDLGTATVGAEIAVLGAGSRLQAKRLVASSLAYNGWTVDALGVIEVGSAGSAAAGTFTVDADGVAELASTLVLSAPVIDNGLIQLDAGASVNLTSLAGAGRVTLAAGARLNAGVVGGSVVIGLGNAARLVIGQQAAGSARVTMAGQGTVLELDQSGSAGALVTPTPTIAGFGPDDTLLFRPAAGAAAPTAVGYTRTGTGSGTLSLLAGTTPVATLTLTGELTGYAPRLAAGTDGAFAITLAGTDPLFDTAWYLRAYPDVAASGTNPYLHFLNTGWKEGRVPTALFDTRYYLKLYPDVARAGINPLLHYESTGWREGRSASPLFDSAYYNAAYPAVAAAGTIPLADYLNGGALAGRNPDAWFDSAYYLKLYPDVARAGLNPLVHYLQSGWKEGRTPSLLFDGAAYLRTYQDVARGGLNPLIHYVTNGRSEGRMAFLTGGTAKADPLIQAAYYDPQLGATLIPTGTAAAQQAAWSYATTGWKAGLNPDAWFDTAYYLAHNPDITRAGVNPLLHYETTGWKEGRAASAQFSTTKYLAAYQDVARAGINPLLHFIQNGQAEGRHAFAV